ncbi:MAG TPA: pyridoxamine 5'-phosphate oxidase [Edaphocola sp.]|nr:pyridoxamine 5'-phosphate oxidase [Edaphocola sp.]
MEEFSKEIAAIRQDYSLSSLEKGEVGDNPVLFFEKWFKEAEDAHCIEVNAMTLATVDEEGMPHARIVLLKGIEHEEFIFFTNYHSKKGDQLKINPHASLVFFWPELQRQVRIEGFVKEVNKSLSDEYFYSRPIESQIGAIASEQSGVISSRKVIEDKVKVIKKSKTIKRPEHWGGYSVKPNKIEFWQGRQSRLHDRIVFELRNDSWKKYRLAP